MTCSECRFWDEHGAIGLCRRRAPSLLGRSGRVGVWPKTVPDAWCGEFSPRPKPAPASAPTLAEDLARLTAARAPAPRPAATGIQELTLPPGWFTDALAAAMGVRCGHPNGFEVQLHVGGTARCPDCSEPQKAQEARA